MPSNCAKERSRVHSCGNGCAAYTESVCIGEAVASESESQIRTEPALTRKVIPKVDDLICAGKSTLLKLMCGDIHPTVGTITRHTHMSIGRYHQHSTEVLDNDKTVIDFFMSKYPNDPPKFVRDLEQWRAFLGRYGVNGKMQTKEISKLSEGQKSRIVFAMICMGNPNMLLLDEPTNHLDLEAIDALAGAINKFDGGLVLVSHDFRLIDQVAKQIWVCDDKKVEIWKGDIRSYKKSLSQKMKAGQDVRGGR